MGQARNTCRHKGLKQGDLMGIMAVLVSTTLAVGMMRMGSMYYMGRGMITLLHCHGVIFADLQYKLSCSLHSIPMFCM